MMEIEKLYKTCGHVIEIKEFCDACGKPVTETNPGVRHKSFGHACWNNVAYYNVICNGCIKKFRDGINETILKFKDELEVVKILNETKQEENL